jgi:hypothetical protein
MKKFLAVAFVAVSLTACHYGQEDAQKTLEANEKYKTDKAEFSTNRGNDGVATEETVAATTDSTASVSDTTTHVK